MAESLKSDMPKVNVQDDPAHKINSLKLKDVVEVNIAIKRLRSEETAEENVQYSENCNVQKRVKLEDVEEVSIGEYEVNDINSSSLPKDVPSYNLSASVDSDAENDFGLMQLALTSTLFVSALETIPALRKKCPSVGIKGNFFYENPNEHELLAPVEKTKLSGQYEVERIIEYDTVNYLYLVKWKGWDNEYNTWEPIDHLTDCEKMLTDFRSALKDLSDANKYAFKKLIFIELLIDELTNDANRDAYLLLKFNGKAACDYKPGDLFSLKKALIRNYFSQCKGLRNRKDYDLVFGKILNDFHIIEHFESFEKFVKFYKLRKGIFKKLMIWENKINHKISREKGSTLIEIENNVDLDLAPNDFNYIMKSIPGTLDVSIRNEPIWFCECDNDCYLNKKLCCPSANDSEMVYNKRGCLKNHRTITIFECNSKCKCSSTCSNRVIQNGMKLAIFKTDNGRGWGVRTLENIPNGRFVTEYVGEVITTDEAERRSELGENPFHSTFFFELEYECETNFEYIVDGSKYGNLSRFINHSASSGRINFRQKDIFQGAVKCSPNLEVYMFWVDNPDVRMPRIALFSRKSISKGEELTFDYRMSPPRMVDANDADNLVKVPCKCMSTECRKFLY